MKLNSSPIVSGSESVRGSDCAIWRVSSGMPRLRVIVADLDISELNPGVRWSRHWRLWTLDTFRHRRYPDCLRVSATHRRYPDWAIGYHEPTASRTTQVTQRCTFTLVSGQHRMSFLNAESWQSCEELKTCLKHFNTETFLNTRHQRLFHLKKVIEPASIFYQKVVTGTWHLTITQYSNILIALHAAYAIRIFLQPPKQRRFQQVRSD